VDITYVSTESRLRRLARITAHELVTDSILQNAEAVHSDGLKVLRLLDLIDQQQDAIQFQISKINEQSQRYFEFLMLFAANQSAFSDSARSSSTMFGVFERYLLGGADSVLKQNHEELDTSFRAHLRYLKDLAETTDDLNESSDILTGIEKVLKEILNSHKTITLLTQQLEEEYLGANTILNEMRSNIILGRDYSIKDKLSNIEEIAINFTTSTYLRFAMIVLVIVLAFLLFYFFLIRPLRWISSELEDIKYGILEIQFPEFRINEVAEISSVLEIFSHYLPGLYERSNQLDEEIIYKNDLENLTQAICQASQAGYIVWGTTGPLLVSSSILELLDLTEELIFVGNPQRFGFNPIQITEGKQRAHLEGKVIAEQFLVSVTGQLIHTELTHLPLHFHGEPCLLTFVRDIRKQKNTERVLHDAKEQAENAVRAKNQFLANISHEIRTPMNGIMGLVYMLKATGISSRQKKYLSRVEETTRSLHSILLDVMDYTQLESGSLTLVSRQFQLERLLENVLDSFKDLAETKEVELCLGVVYHRYSTFWADNLRLSQILKNLVSNAIKFTDKGTVLIKTEVLSEDPSTGELVFLFSVSDTGEGFPEEQKKRIFNPFSQLDSSSTRKQGGLGLGLSISHQLVEKMGGKIWCESTVGVGSVFSFTIKLPLARWEPDLLPKDKIFNGFQALVVGPKGISQDTLVSHLHSFSIKVNCCENTVGAIKALADEDVNPDLIIIDGKDHNLSEFMAVLRLEYPITKLPSLLWAYPFGTKKVEVNSDLYNSVLIRPYSPTTLYKALCQALDLKLKEKAENLITPIA
jgi:signal transduction histidine kinase